MRKVGLVDIIQAGHGDRYQVRMISAQSSNYAELVLKFRNGRFLAFVIENFGLLPF